LGGRLLHCGIWEWGIWEWDIWEWDIWEWDIWEWDIWDLGCIIGLPIIPMGPIPIPIGLQVEAIIA
jgi:hypothetical protein